MRFDRRGLLTIPNLLSLLRLLMIPLFVWLYMNGYEEYTAAVLILSGLTDIIDGFIARRFGQITDFGKALDPVADKLTQAAMLLCLMSRYQMMVVPFVLLVIKEITASIFGLLVIHHTGLVPSAQWHGKITTLMLYGMMIIHVVWQDIPTWASNTLNGICIILMLVSLVLYAKHHIDALKNARSKES